MLGSAAAVAGGSGTPSVSQPQHGLEARATPEGRAQTLAPQREPTDRPGWDAAGDQRAAVEDASDKTTQGESLDHEWPIPEAKLRRKLSVPSQGRLYYVRYALKMGWSIEQVHQLTNIDPWFLAQMKELVEFEAELARMRWTRRRGADRDEASCGQCEAELGYSDVQTAAG
jgi:hypothetical protein